MATSVEAKKLAEDMARMFKESQGAASSAPEEKKAKGKKKEDPLFNPVTSNTDGMLSYEEIVGEKHPDGKERWYPEGIRHKRDEWPTFMADRIPEDMPWYVPDHRLLPMLLDSMAYDKIPKIYGHPGAGKDTDLEWLCNRLNMPYTREDGKEGIEIFNIVGGMIPDGTGDWVESKGLLWLFVEHGGLYVRSEPDVVPAGVGMLFQSLYEPKRILQIPDHPDPEKSRLRAHRNFRIALTSNTRGTGDNADMYTATTVQDASNLNRIDKFGYKDYMPEDKEVEMLQKSFPDITPRFARKMVLLGNQIRSGWKAGEIELAFSPRQLMEWAETALRDGEPVRGFKECYYNVLNDDERGAVRESWNHVDFGCPLV